MLTEIEISEIILLLRSSKDMNNIYLLEAAVKKGCLKQRIDKLVLIWNKHSSLEDIRYILRLNERNLSI